MAAENLHNNLPESALHNPKGFSTASNDTYLTKDSTGGLEWAAKPNGSRVSAELNIGDWDMDADINVNVAHSHNVLEWKTIRNVNILIRTDADNSYTELTNFSSGSALGGSWSLEATQFVLYRITGGAYDNTNYDSTSYNRGWITYEYTPTDAPT